MGRRPSPGHNLQAYLGLICYYYYKFNRYDENGKFKSTKQLSKIQTKNIRSILGINTELFSNIYDRTLDNWYSIYHNVDKLFGSKDYSQSAIVEEINDGILIEKELGRNRFGTSKVHLFENATELFKYTKWHHDRSFIRNCITIVQ